MIISSPATQFNPRVFALGLIVAGGLVILLLALARVQLFHAAHFDQREEAQSLRRIRVPSTRGEIRDRHGRVLADNRPSYDIVIYLEQLPRESKKFDVVRAAGQTLGTLSRALNRPVTLSDRDVRIHYARRRPIPLPVWQDVPVGTMAAFVERASTLPGADLIVTPVRQYPFGSLAAHALGYVNRDRAASDDEALEQYYYYQPDTVGKQGVERSLDEWLRGSPGGRTIRVSPGGTMVGEVAEKPAERGHTVTLTLDVRVQQLTEAALAAAPLRPGQPLRGAAVVLEVETGEVLALASVPGFDPNLFHPGGSAEPVRALFADLNRPMLNRAYGGLYAPGSTFKPITLLAALESGRSHVEDTVTCGGSLPIGNRSFGCWKREGHGTVNGMEAMRRSCDVWYYQKGMATGVEAIERMARQFGLGQPTGFDIGTEYAGLVPSAAWKRRERGERWWDGDTAQLAIGQSFLLVTPVQMAVVAAALANGGTVLRPFLVKRIETAAGALVRETKPEVRGRVNVSARNMELVRQSLLGAVGEADGTAHRAHLPGLRVAGKTGTAEFDLSEGGQRRRINRAWFIGFAPYEKPRYAVAVMLEEADGGGYTAAPVAQRIFAGLFGREPVEVAGGGGD